MTTYTYADMQARIASEMKRGDLQTDAIGGNYGTSIQAAIQSAVQQYQLTRFYFSEKAYASWATAANKETYATADGVPADIVEIDTLTVIYSSVRHPLIEREWDWIEARQTGQLSGGVPTEFAYYQQQFRLFPIPTQISTLNLAYWQSVAAPSAATDAGPWMNDAEELIRRAAKKRLYAEVISDDEEAAKLAGLEKEALDTLRKTSAMRAGTGRVVATRF